MPPRVPASGPEPCGGNKFRALKSVTERCISENVEFSVYLIASKILQKVLPC